MDTEHRAVYWNSSTVGDWDGLILDLKAPQDTEVAFHSAQHDFSFVLGQISQDPLEISLEGLEQRITVSRIARNGPRDVEFSYIDSDVQVGSNPYWLWVTQVDGAIGWSSPIYLSYKKWVEDNDNNFT